MKYQAELKEKLRKLDKSVTALIMGYIKKKCLLKIIKVNGDIELKITEFFVKLKDEIVVVL